MGDSQDFDSIGLNDKILDVMILGAAESVDELDCRCHIVTTLRQINARRLQKDRTIDNKKEN